VPRSIVSSDKVKILDAMDVVSRLSRWRSLERVVLNALAKACACAA
jgi:hypothetical protein